MKLAQSSDRIGQEPSVEDGNLCLLRVAISVQAAISGHAKFDAQAVADALIEAIAANIPPDRNH